jgi:hypothetical protein
MANKIADANQAYGALTEGLYIAGFTFERVMTKALALLKSGDWKTVGDGFDDVNVFVRSLKLDQFKVAAEQRREFRERVQELQPKVSNRSIAKALGVGKDTINRDVGANAPRGGRKVAENGTAGGANAPLGASDGRRDAARIGQRDMRSERREEKVKSMASAAALTGCYSVFYADPPWEDEFGPNDRQVENHYPTMSDAEIEALDVRSIAADDAMLFLWATPHMLPRSRSWRHGVSSIGRT